jgi:hypothetical protein
LQYKKGLRCWDEHSEINSFATTEIYAHLNSKAKKGLENPLNDLKIEITDEHKKVITP